MKGRSLGEKKKTWAITLPGTTALTLGICQTVAATVAEQGTAINTTYTQRNIRSLFFQRQFNLKISERA